MPDPEPATAGIAPSVLHCACMDMHTRCWPCLLQDMGLELLRSPTCICMHQPPRHADMGKACGLCMAHTCPGTDAMVKCPPNPACHSVTCHKYELPVGRRPALACHPAPWSSAHEVESHPQDIPEPAEGQAAMTTAHCASVRYWELRQHFQPCTCPCHAPILPSCLVSSSSPARM